MITDKNTRFSVGPNHEEILLASHSTGGGLQETILSIPTISCGGCIRNIEQSLGKLDGIENARVNLSTKRVTIRWQDAPIPPPFVETLLKLGYEPHLLETGAEEKDRTLPGLIRALAVAGFGAGNIMLLSVSVWSGAAPETRDLFHWISAFIALPVLVYSGRIFFRSAWQALRHWQTNMDVPISIGVLLAFGMSLYDTILHAQHAYFDASVTLLFFLLIGRALDHMMRERARMAVKGLARFAARSALVLRDDGARDYLPVAEIESGMTILLATGERVPVDARVEAGTSDLDCSLVTGESMPQFVTIGAHLQAGTLNLTGPLTLKATATAKDSFLAEMVRLMEAVEAGRSSYRRVADRVARLYTPFVHAAAFLSFIGWLAATDNIHQALTIAIAVLIITCPCALGLAVPMVQVVAARRLFEKGIMVKDGSALERLSEIDAIVFDKTGTLTLGRPRLRDSETIDPANLALAAAMAVHSRHSLSRALVTAASWDFQPLDTFDSCSEYPGLGLEAVSGTDVYRLGRNEWALGDATPYQGAPDGLETVLSKNGELLEVFQFGDAVRPDAKEMVDKLTESGLKLEILSGDRSASVQQLAHELGIPWFSAGALPDEKVAHLATLAAAGHKVLMVGDGLNDAPALAAAHVSMAPATAADVGRNTADFVFLRNSLEAIPYAVALSQDVGRLIRQNFALAIIYNTIALPFAALGVVTPLVAALAMSSSSILVVANALRLNGGKQRGRRVGTAVREADRSAFRAMEPAE